MRKVRHFAEPVSQWAVWSRRLALFALPVLAIGVFSVREEWFGLFEGLAIIASGMLITIVSIIFGIIGFVWIWNEGYRGTNHLVSTFGIGLAVLIQPFVYLIIALLLPPINDITTDFSNVPTFDAATMDRGVLANAVNYGGLEIALKQGNAYPEIGPLDVRLSVQAAYDLAHNMIERRGWKILNRVQPNPELDFAKIEAVAKTNLLGFPDDVVVRIQPSRLGARIDMRSASRYGQHDFGQNARRIDEFLTDFTTRIDEFREEPEA